MSFLKGLSLKRSAVHQRNKEYGDTIAEISNDSFPKRTLPPRRFSNSEEEPPAYTPRSNRVIENVDCKIPSPKQLLTETNDSPYAFLAQFDTIFLIDDSGSMTGRSWQETAEALRVITPICTNYDDDGIDIYFLNHREQKIPILGGYDNVTSTAAVREIFDSVRPANGTPTGTHLNKILNHYRTKSKNGLEQLVPDYDPLTKKQIARFQHDLSSDEVKALDLVLGYSSANLKNFLASKKTKLADWEPQNNLRKSIEYLLKSLKASILIGSPLVACERGLWSVAGKLATSMRTS